MSNLEKQVITVQDFEVLINEFNQLKIIESTLSDVTNSRILVELYRHKVALHWVCKIENNRYKIPIPPKQRTPSKVSGEYLHTLLQLCIAVHGRQDEIGLDVNFKTGFDWFVEINYELLKAGINRVINPVEFEKGVYDGQKKKCVLSEFNSWVSKLKILENPYSPEDSNSSALVLLISSGIKLSEQKSFFKRNYWTPFIIAGRNISKELTQSCWQLVSITNGVISRQKVGRAKKIL